MKVIPIAAYLSEFGDEPLPESVLPVDLDDFSQPVPVTLAADAIGAATAIGAGGAIGAASATGGVDQGCSLSDGLAERFEAGIAEGKNQAQAEFADQLAQQEALLSEQFNQQLAILQGDLGERLTVAIKTELHNIEVTIANALAAVIRPFVSGAVEIRVLDELTTAINDILSDPQSSQMTVRGPKALLNVLEDKLNNTSAAIIFVESDDPEICVEHGREKIESRLTDWSNLIKSELR